AADWAIQYPNDPYAHATRAARKREEVQRLANLGNIPVSQIMVVTDGTFKVNGTITDYSNTYSAWFTTGNPFRYVHAGLSANVLYLDGRVETHRETDFASVYVSDFIPGTDAGVNLVYTP